MSHETLRVISSNTYRNQALGDPRSLEQLLPHDGIPTVTAFQEVFPWREDVAKIIEDLGYTAVLPEAPLGLAFAVSPELPAPTPHDSQSFQFAFERIQLSPAAGFIDRKKRFGLFVLTTTAARPLIIGNGQEPVAASPLRPKIVRWKAERLQEIAHATENSEAIVMEVGDRNHHLQRQLRGYHAIQQSWGGTPLFPDGHPTYLLKNSRFYTLHSRMGVRDPQLDGMHLRPPRNLQLVAGETNLGHNQIGFTTRAWEVHSDHLALEALLHIPERA